MWAFRTTNLLHFSPLGALQIRGDALRDDSAAAGLVVKVDDLARLLPAQHDAVMVSRAIGGDGQPCRVDGSATLCRVRRQRLALGDGPLEREQRLAPEDLVTSRAVVKPVERAQLRIKPCPEGLLGGLDGRS